MVAAASAPVELDLRERLDVDAPLALADAHRSLPVGARLRILAPAAWGPDHVRDLVVGAGCSPERWTRRPTRPAARSSGMVDTLAVLAVRERQLPDVVGPGMRLLLVGLNPSLYSADAGVGFARPGNRFWPAALEAGLGTAPRDSRSLLLDHHVGMTDLVKRATVGAAELSVAEYVAGLARLERLCAWLQPGAACFLGLDGWRKAVDRRAVAGWQDRTVGGVAAYVMPNPSGLNAHATVSSLAEHLAAAAAGPSRPAGARLR